MWRRLIIALGYVLAAGLVVVLTVGLVAYGQDYSYDFAHHRIVRSGNVILQTVPSGVQLSMDGKTVKKKSFRLDAGLSYAFKIMKDGYHTWQKDLAVVAGRVTLVQYVVLVPNKPATQTLQTTLPITAQAVSLDHRHLAYITGGVVSTYDYGASRSTKVYTAQAATDAAAAETLTSVAWSDDASRLVVMSKVGDVVTTRVMSATGTAAVNLTDQYRFDFSSLRFASGSSNQLFWISPDGLRRLDLDSQSVSAVLATGVNQIEPIDGNLLYVQTTALGQSLWVLDGRGNKPQQLVAALPTSNHFGLAYANYRGTDALAVVPGSTKTGTLYTNVFGDTPVARTVAHDVIEASFSPDGNILAFTGTTSVTTYDLDQSTVFGTPVQYTFSAITDGSRATWFDNFHLLLNEGGDLVWREFDGQNQVNLGVAAGNLPAVASADKRSIYTWSSKLAEQYELQSLLIKQ